MNKQKTIRYKSWLESVNSWADKHGITEQQAIDILFFDQVIPGVITSEIFWHESNEFAEHYKYG